MTSARVRGLGLVAAVLAVLAALWVLYGPADRSSRRSARAGDDDASADGGSAKGSAAGGRRGGAVAAREVTIAGHGRVSGHVVDEDGGAVVEGQLILWCLNADGEVARIRDGVVALDREGHFEGPGCKGRVCPQLNHPARVPAAPWTLRPGVEAELETRALARLWGQVVDPQGQPVAGAQIVVAAPTDEDPGAVLPVVSPRTSSDADGEFSLAKIERPPCDPCQQAREACHTDLLPVIDRVLITARVPGFAPGSIDIDLEEVGDADNPVKLVLREAEAAITGRLLDAAGEALPRAVVLARSELRRHEQHRAEAEGGVFAFEGLADGPYTLRAIQDGRELLQRGSVEPGATVELRLDEISMDIAVRVVDTDGNPWPDVQVDGGPFRRQRTDAQGLVRARRVVPGTYISRVKPPRQRARAREWELSASEVTGATTDPVVVLHAGSEP
ncbi:MAG: carboxypeptidase-like regulatory domain-containing protein [Myxococcota bacterium]